MYLVLVALCACIIMWKLRLVLLLLVYIQAANCVVAQHVVNYILYATFTYTYYELSHIVQDYMRLHLSADSFIVRADMATNVLQYYNMQTRLSNIMLGFTLQIY